MTKNTSLPVGCVHSCPGCAHRDRSRDSSEKQKQQWLTTKLQPWSERLQPLRSVTGERRYGYRDRVCLSCEYSSRGWQFGLKRRDELIAIPHCPIHSDRINAVVALLGRTLPEQNRFPLAYLVQSGAQLVLVVKQAERPDTRWLTTDFYEALAATGTEGLWLHLHPSAGRKVFAKNRWLLLWGQPRSRDHSGLWYGPAAFQQLIPELFNEALDSAQQYLSPTPDSRVIDLYCGAGSSLKRWAGVGARTLGVEIAAEALSCARQNVPEAELLRGSCLHRIPQLQQWAEQTSGTPLLYANPPRTGMETAVTAWIGQHFRPRRLACLSCSAGTLRRDLEILCEYGYSVEQLIPFDFFPQTLHVETLALLRDTRP